MIEQRILAVMDSVAVRLHGPATHVYSVLVKQAVVTGWAGLAEGLALAAALVWGVGVLRQWWKVSIPDNYDNDDKRIARYVATVIACVAVFILVLCGVGPLICDGVQHIVNPEYYAIRDMMAVVQR